MVLRPVLTMEDVQAELLQWEFSELVSLPQPQASASSVRPQRPATASMLGAVPTSFVDAAAYASTFKWV